MKIAAWAFLASVVEVTALSSAVKADVTALHALHALHAAPSQKTSKTQSVEDVLRLLWADAPSVVFGLAILAIGLAMTWFNEERSARLSLLQGSVKEVVKADANHPDPDRRGRLVHVQGVAQAKQAVSDPRFPELSMYHTLQLQCTLEAFEWVQTKKVAKESERTFRCHTEWTTVHQDSSRFKKPSPENPRLPLEVCLGTVTTACHEVHLGQFLLPEAMVRQFNRFEPAFGAADVPSSMYALGLCFVHRPEDGFFYARPSTRHVQPQLFAHCQVGDLRARFLVAGETNATAVAVQHFKEGRDTFLPFRVVSKGFCTTEQEARARLESERPRELRLGCAAGGCTVGSLCCCPCSTISCLCAQEVVTEEIFYVSDKFESCERPFLQVVGRSPWKVAAFRAAALAVMYLGVSLVLHPIWNQVSSFPGLRACGGAAGQVLLLMFLASSWGCVTAAAIAPHSLAPALLLVCLSLAVLFLPAALSSFK